VSECVPAPIRQDQKKQKKNAPMVMRKNDNQSVVASFATLFMSSMVAPGMVPEGIPLTMVMLSFR
jgi:hypothetical protein